MTSHDHQAGPGGFPSTHWSLVGRAGHVSGERRREAMGALLDRYMPALRAHLVLGRRLSADRADDLLQGFVADKVIEQNLPGRAEKARGRFRSFLVAALDHYVVTQFRHETSRKRAPARPILDIADARDVSAPNGEPGWEYALVWARQIIEEARRRTEAYCNATERPDVWHVFSERVLRVTSGDAAPPAHRPIAGDLDRASSKAASNLLVTGKRLFARMLRSVVAEYAADEREIDEEIDDLMRILSRHG